MDVTISMSAATRRAGQLRALRQHANSLPPGRHRDDLHDQLDADALALASRKLAKG